jgi:hypothetical protein
MKRTAVILLAVLALVILVPGAALADGPQAKTGSKLTFTISASDPDRDSLTYSASDLPEGATFDPDTHTFSWTPNYAQEGVYVVRFTVSDGELSDYEDVTITVVQPYPDWDVNWDGATNILDIIAIVQHWGETGVPGWLKEDANEDGTIDILDIILVGQHIT